MPIEYLIYALRSGNWDLFVLFFLRSPFFVSNVQVYIYVEKKNCVLTIYPGELEIKYLKCIKWNWVVFWVRDPSLIKKRIYLQNRKDQYTFTYTYLWARANLSRENRKNDDNGEKKINRIGELKKKQFKFENQCECTESVVLFGR